jgi:hypothetical protein
MIFPLAMDLLLHAHHFALHHLPVTNWFFIVFRHHFLAIAITNVLCF